MVSSTVPGKRPAAPLEWAGAASQSAWSHDEPGSSRSLFHGFVVERVVDRGDLERAASTFPT
jgi:hypothetical protein